jgi:predicted nuclease of restriction endonuclease-like (RecB) superfamily
MKLEKNKSYLNLFNSIRNLLNKARCKAYVQINTILVKTYWEIGQYIVKFEQVGNIKAEYGKNLIDNLARDLKNKYGRGFSRSNLIYMRLFYIKYPKSETVSNFLTWSHYFEILKIEDNLERSFYEKQSINEKWSVRELKRQIDSSLFERLALSKNKQKVLELSKKGQIINRAQDIIKDEYCLEFLGLEQKSKYFETDLEKAVIDNLERFLLELGKGFAFVKRQYSIHINNKHFHVDLVFYNMMLKCFVLIDLKTKEVSHKDIGQMNMYLNYFNREEKYENDNNAIGIVLSAKKDDVEVEYALGTIGNKIFASKYKLYLPDKEILRIRLEKIFVKRGISNSK